MSRRRRSRTLQRGRRLNWQRINMQLNGSHARQYRVNVVTVKEAGIPVDQWGVNEAPSKLVRALHRRIAKIIGKCRLA